MRIAAFGFRSIPLREGCAGADKFALELLPRLVKQGHHVVGYNRLYPGQEPMANEYQGVLLKYFKTVENKGFDTLLHSAKVCFDIIKNNTADIVHVQNGGNSVFAIPLRLAGKHVFLSQDGVDWKRGKWPWYGKIYLALSTLLTAFLPNRVIFDNIFVRNQFSRIFHKPFDFIPFGSEVDENELDCSILDELGLKPGEYFLFVGRFIPDKGLQYLIPAFERLNSSKKLVLVGGSPNPNDFDTKLRSTHDPRILFPGFLYGAKTHALMKHAYAYIQPSDVEGLSPVILENMAMATPIICSDIQENKYVVAETGLLFRKADPAHLQEVMEWALDHPDELKHQGRLGQMRALKEFSWDAVTDAHIKLFRTTAQ